MLYPPRISDDSKYEPEEGVIKFDLRHRTTPPVVHPLLGELNAWREILFTLGLTGQDPKRYGGLGYGNVSIRESRTRFLISGSQTGGIAELQAKHYVRVLNADIPGNRIESEGPCHPSSETMSHAAAYAAADEIQCVFHVHHPQIWQAASDLGIAQTPPGIPYGTIGMADCISTLLKTRSCEVIAMKGHEDGLIAVGRTLKDAGTSILDLLAKAKAMRLNNAE